MNRHRLTARHIALLLTLLSFLLPVAAFTQQAETNAPQQDLPPGQQAQPQQLPPGSAPLRVMVGKSVLINTTDRLKRVSVTDPAIADAVVVTPNQLLIHGRQPGEVTLVIWDEAERSRSFDLRVDADVTSAGEEIRALFPEQKINVTASRGAIVLSGHVWEKGDAERAQAVAQAYSPNVVNALTFGPVGGQAVLLEVKFAEVDRAALSQFGSNFFSTNAKGIGTTTTGQFGGFGEQQIEDVHIFGVPTPGIESEQTIPDPLNIFLFRPDIHLGVVIRALQQKNLLQILAEPNLIALNGREASFLAGGEFPFPVVQPGQGFTAVTIQFREFGVRLSFTPVITPNGAIRLRVKPEVSALDFANALTISGFIIPALSTRRADTELELQDGQSFVIAGLMDNRVTSITTKIPWLGDIPILGQLFRSKNLQKSRSELMVLVTARRVAPTTEPPPPPRQPQPFLQPEEFDNSKPGGGGPQ